MREYILTSGTFGHSTPLFKELLIGSLSKREPGQIQVL